MSSEEHVKTRIEGNIGIITVDHPPVNALNADVLGQLDKALDDISKNESVSGVVITGGGNNAFCAGADIKSFAKLTSCLLYTSDAADE